MTELVGNVVAVAGSWVGLTTPGTVVAVDGTAVVAVATAVLLGAGDAGTLVGVAALTVGLAAAVGCAELEALEELLLDDDEAVLAAGGADWALTDMPVGANGTTAISKASRPLRKRFRCFLKFIRAS
jgi:hypothetical protein